MAIPEKEPVGISQFLKANPVSKFRTFKMGASAFACIGLAYASTKAYRNGQMLKDADDAEELWKAGTHSSGMENVDTFGKPQFGKSMQEMIRK